MTLLMIVVVIWSVTYFIIFWALERAYILDFVQKKILIIQT